MTESTPLSLSEGRAEPSKSGNNLLNNCNLKILAIAIMGVAMYAVCAMVEKRMTRWAFRGEIVG